MALNVNVTVVDLPDPGASDTLLVFKAPSDNIGGGIRLLDAFLINHATTSAGNSFTAALHKWSSGGTPAVNGTIAAAIGGTTDHWTTDIPKEFTLDDDYTFLDAGEWLALVYTEVGTGNLTNGKLVLHYAVGK